MKVIFWDFDGTLIDSRAKNYHVTKNIIQNITGHDFKRYDFLKSFDNYKRGISTIANWREIYSEFFDFDEEKIDYLGSLWTEFQLRDTTPTPLFSGIKNVIITLSHYPMAIISQNAKANIARQLNENNILECFNYIVGFEEVEIRKQKPEPDGILICMEKMELKNGSTIFYIGDHETDVLLVKNTNDVLKERNSLTKVISVGAFYGNDQQVSDWKIRPDFYVNDAEEIIKIID